MTINDDRWSMADGRSQADINYKVGHRSPAIEQRFFPS